MIVERSGDHCHLTEETFIKLFGHRGVLKRRLLNEKYFVFEETLLVKEIGILPILGPFRKYNQIEVSGTTCRKHKLDYIKAESGDTRHTRKLGVYGMYHATISAICIQSVPHAHIPCVDKVYKTGTISIGNVEINNCPLYFDPTITVESIHLDNDWYNAIGLDEGYVRVRN